MNNIIEYLGLTLVLGYAVYLLVKRRQWKRNKQQWNQNQRAHAQRIRQTNRNADPMDAPDIYPDTGGKGYTPADLRGVSGPSQPKETSDAWLLGIAAVPVEERYLDHGSWSLTPQMRTAAWQRKIDQLLRSLGADTRENWRAGLEYYQRELAVAQGPENIVWHTSELAFWIRLGCAGEHISESEARNLTQLATIRLRTLNCQNWETFAGYLAAHSAVDLRGTDEQLRELGWPWHTNTWN